MKKGLFKKSVAVMLASVMAVSMAGCGGDKSGSKKDEKKEDTKNMVYESSDISLEGVEGDIGTFIVKGDKIYFSTYEWIEGKTETDGSEDKDAEGETAADSTEGEETEGEVNADTSEEDMQEGAATEETTESNTSEEEKEAEDSSEAGDDAADENAENEDEAEANQKEETVEDVEGTSVNRMYVASLDGSDVKEIPMPELSENEYMNYMLISDAGEIIMCLSSYDEKKDISNYAILKIDENGKELGREDITKTLNLNNETYLSKMMLDSKGRIIAVLERSVIILDENYKLLGEVKGEQNTYLEGAAVTKDGNIVCASSGEECAQVQMLDAEGKKWGETIKLDLRYFSGSDSLMDGNGDYDFYYKDESGIYGYSIADKKAVKLMDYVASNLASDQSYGIIPVGKDMMLGTIWEENGKSKLVKYTKVDPSQITDKTTITFGAMYLDDNIKKAAIEFNKTNKEYQIEFKDYGNEEDPMTKMNADIIAGNIPDIICLSNLPIDQYAAKGILEDLNPYFEKDSELNTSDMIPAVYEATQIDGKLYYITPSFSISTLVGSTADVGKESGWTFDDLKALLEEKGDSVRPFYSENKSDMLYSFLGSGLGDFIDWETGKCSFDQQDFKDILELCNSIGKNEEMEYDEDAPSMPALVKEGKVLFNEGWVSLDEIQLYKAMYGGDITFIGYPNRDKEGSYFQLDTAIGIYSKSKVKDAAWEFIRTFMTKEYQGKNGNLNNAPTRQDCFDMFIKTRTATEKYTDEFGQEVEPYSSSWGYDDLEVEIKPSTQEEVDMYKNLIDSTKRVGSYNYSLIEIVQEEAKPYFAGEKSLDETVKIIQNRVETYVNENR